MKNFLTMFRAREPSELSTAQKHNIFTQFKPNSDTHLQCKIDFWNYVMFNPPQLDAFAQSMMSLVRETMRVDDPDTCQCGCAVYSIDAGTFLEKAARVMQEATSANVPCVELFKMGSPHTLALGPADH